MSDPYETLHSQIIGEYRLVRKLGGGGFGTVYLAEKLQDHTQVAIKILQVPLAKKEDFRDFINEARTIRLHHPHIVPLFDFGLSREDYPFLVMEYAAKGTLRDRHPKGSQVPLTTIVEYVEQVASALQYAHDRRIVHRDVKPENMLLRDDGTLLLSDFGLAKIIESSAFMSVQTQVGTPVYMAPEQYQGYPSLASDQYALAVVVYEWISGTRPFQGSSFSIAVQHMTVPPPSLLEQVPTLSPVVEQVVFKALAKEPEQRFASVQEFATALCSAASDSTVPRIELNELPPNPVPAQGVLISQSVTVTPMLTEQPSESPVTSHPLLANLPTPEQQPQRIRQGGFRLQWLLWASTGLIVLGLLLGSLYIPSLAQRGATSVSSLSQGSKPASTQTPEEIYTRYTSGSPTRTDPSLDGTVWPWFNAAPTYGVCSFTDGAYHSSTTHPDSFVSCIASDDQLTNYAYQVQVTIHSGDAAGLIVDYLPTSPNVTFDAFLFCRDAVKPCQTAVVWLSHAQGGGSGCATSGTFDCDKSYPAFINTSLGAQNTLTAIVLSQTIYLYINAHPVGTVRRISSKGGVGVAVYNKTSNTDATFSNAKLWVLPS